jgi:hypothetical protein
MTSSRARCSRPGRRFPGRVLCARPAVRLPTSPRHGLARPGHPSFRKSFREARWIRGASPRMTWLDVAMPPTARRIPIQLSNSHTSAFSRRRGARGMLHSPPSLERAHGTPGARCTLGLRAMPSSAITNAPRTSGNTDTPGVPYAVVLPASCVLSPGGHSSPGAECVSRADLPRRTLHPSTPPRGHQGPHDFGRRGRRVLPA